MATRSAKIDQKADLIWAIADKLRENGSRGRTAKR